jgi:hypothetical protein
MKGSHKMATKKVLFATRGGSEKGEKKRGGEKGKGPL